MTLSTIFLKLKLNNQLVEMPPLISVIVCCHNDKQYINKCLSALIEACTDLSFEIVFVADRCRDSSGERAKAFSNVRVVEKTWHNHRCDGYAESLNAGLCNCKGKYVTVVDVDMIVPRTFLSVLDLFFTHVKVGALAFPRTEIFQGGLTSALVYVTQRRARRSGCRIFLTKTLKEHGGFSETALAPDTEVDLRFEREGIRVITVSDVCITHVRQVTLRKWFNNQIRSGKARRRLGISFFRTLAHSILRFRPFCISSYVVEAVYGSRTCFE